MQDYYVSQGITANLMNIVITSYSIHYTKLYDEFCIEDIIFDSRVLLKCMFGCSNYGYGHTCPSRTGSLSPWEYERVFKNYKKGIIIHSIDKKVSQDVSYEIDRITSYNVCYTKLLRFFDKHINCKRNKNHK